jgi:hypothetical protein
MKETVQKQDERLNTPYRPSFFTQRAESWGLMPKDYSELVSLMDTSFEYPSYPIITKSPMDTGYVIVASRQLGDLDSHRVTVREECLCPYFGDLVGLTDKTVEYLEKHIERAYVYFFFTIFIRRSKKLEQLFADLDRYFYHNENIKDTIEYNGTFTWQALDTHIKECVKRRESRNRGSEEE